MKISRREILKAGATAALAAASPLMAPPLLMSPSSDLMPRSGKRRVVIAGGGWGGVTVARHIREQAPDLDVVLLERNRVFWSCPLSNKWLIDVVDTNFLVHSYMSPARKFGYTFIQSEITDIDRAKKRVQTPQGYLDYDWLVVAPGIRYNFEAWFGNDRKAIDYTRTTYPTDYCSRRNSTTTSGVPNCGRRTWTGSVTCSPILPTAELPGFSSPATRTRRVP